MKWSSQWNYHLLWREPLHFSLCCFVCMYMCARVYMYVGKHVYVFSSVWKTELVCCPWSCSSCFLIQGFWFLNRFFGSPVWLGWLAREPQESLCFCLPSISMTSTWRHTQLFAWMREIKLKLAYLKISWLKLLLSPSCEL